jgi:hypothetical protein
MQRSRGLDRKIQTEVRSSSIYFVKFSIFVGSQKVARIR